MDMRDPGGGIQIRLVFDKALDSSIETVTMDPSKAPGATNTYALVGVVELDDQAGMPVASVIYLDNGGSSIYSSDLELVPFGSAIVIKPNTPLDAASTYTVKILNPGAIKDCEGNAAVGLGGGALPTSFTFKTEDLTPNSGGIFGGGTPAAVGLDYPDFSDATADMPATIAANEVVQISFFENIAGDMAVVTPTMVPAGAKIIAFGERFNDPTACPMFASGDPGGASLDIVNADSTDLTTAMPVNWPLGDYTIHVSVKDINGRSTFEGDFSFTVTDPSTDTMDPNIFANHLTPAQCTL